MQWNADRQQAFIDALRADGYFPDDDSTLKAMGEQICYEIRQNGYEAMRDNLSQSSFSLTQQTALVQVAQSKACSYIDADHESGADFR